MLIMGLYIYNYLLPFKVLGAGAVELGHSNHPRGYTCVHDVQ